MKEKAGINYLYAPWKKRIHWKPLWKSLQKKNLEILTRELGLVD